jgi:hypothetical protein
MVQHQMDLMATHERAILEQRQKHPPARVKRRQPLRLEHARVGRPLLDHPPSDIVALSLCHCAGLLVQQLYKSCA